MLLINGFVILPSKSFFNTSNLEKFTAKFEEEIQKKVKKSNKKNKNKDSKVNTLNDKDDNFDGDGDDSDLNHQYREIRKMYKQQEDKHRTAALKIKKSMSQTL